MNETVDLSVWSMLMCGLLLLVPVVLTLYLRPGTMRTLLVSTLRMCVQLVLVGFFLEYLFRFNNAFFNLAWFMVMLLVAVLSVIRSSGLKVRKFLFSVFLSLFLSNIFVVLYFNAFIVRLDMLFDARYMIAIGGMVLGNSLRANIVGLGDFYKAVDNESCLYQYHLSLGATRFEAIRPFVKRSFMAALNPTIANMATMGIVSLPGMMTGQILGGSVPLEAIRYQIAIMVAILATTVLSIAFSILFTVRFSFDKSGILKKDIFAA